MSLLKNAKTSFVLNRGFHWVKKKIWMMKKESLWFHKPDKWVSKIKQTIVVCKLISFIAAIRHFNYCSTQHSVIEPWNNLIGEHSSPFCRQIRHCVISLVHLHKFMLNDFSVKSPWLTLSFVPTTSTTKHDNSQKIETLSAIIIFP